MASGSRRRRPLVLAQRAGIVLAALRASRPAANRASASSRSRSVLGRGRLGAGGRLGRVVEQIAAGRRLGDARSLRAQAPARPADDKISSDRGDADCGRTDRGDFVRAGRLQRSASSGWPIAACVSTDPAVADLPPDLLNRLRPRGSRRLLGRRRASSSGGALASAGAGAAGPPAAGRGGSGRLGRRSGPRFFFAPRLRAFSSLGAWPVPSARLALAAGGGAPRAWLSGRRLGNRSVGVGIDLPAGSCGRWGRRDWP